MTNIISAKNVNKERCKTCIFHDDQEIITQERQAEIQTYLLTGKNHVCHTTNKICKGGRDFQLQMFHRLGFIEKPTNDALYKKIDEVMKHD